jgi:hypothetical protein
MGAEPLKGYVLMSMRFRSRLDEKIQQTEQKTNELEYYLSVADSSDEDGVAELGNILRGDA